jgi:putative glutamine amidotransferase
MTSRPPRIGISCDFETITDKRGAPSPRYLLQEAYVSAVERAGGEPWLLPHLAPERAASVLEVLDGLVLSGGDFDVPPHYYGESARYVTGVREARSAFERALILAARERDLPLLGVCGGMQILNVTLAGTLYQDLCEKPGCLPHQQPHDKRRPHHPVAVKPGTLLASLVGGEALEVNSTHHQLVKTVGPGVVACASAPDGVIEAIEATGARFMLGVQWHPEALQHDPPHAAIYAGLVRAASGERQGARRGTPGAGRAA